MYRGRGNKGMIRVNGVGCCLLDRIYSPVDLDPATMASRIPFEPGETGIEAGKLVFSEDLEAITGESVDNILSGILGPGTTTTLNIGGPCIVAMIHAAQMIAGGGAEFHYFGATGSDESGRILREMLARTPVHLSACEILQGNSPVTHVLSDPGFGDGTGDRAFINTLGVAALYDPSYLGPQFFDSDILLFGATALVPEIHDRLTALLEKSRNLGLVNVVATVFDFRNERRSPGQAWPLGDPGKSFRHMDLLIMDEVEALAISSCPDLQQAAAYFIEAGTGAFMITRGAEDIILYSGGGLFAPLPLQGMPVISILPHIRPGMTPDTTGCGDNFAGGVLYSMIRQMEADVPGGLDLAEAARWGIASGACTALVAGGVVFENGPGEKLERVLPFYHLIRERTGV